MRVKFINLHNTFTEEMQTTSGPMFLGTLSKKNK